MEEIMNIIAITNRSLCQEDFFTRIERLANSSVEKIILREKDLKEEEYKQLAARCKSICNAYGKPLFINSYIEAAEELEIWQIQLSYSDFVQAIKTGKLQRFQEIGVSVHSLEEARWAVQNGCDFLITGHIFATDCKKGLPPRGISFLENICEGIKKVTEEYYIKKEIKVYGIGGINTENIEQIRLCTTGACIMSLLMQCDNVSETLLQLQ